MSNAEPAYGHINGHAVGIILKEIVRRAMVAARTQLQKFEVRVKGKKRDGGDDFVTSIDLAAQKIYVKSLRECFPCIGIIAEEESCEIPPDPEFEGCYFTIDPIDGTAALKRRQSHGIGTMLAFVWKSEIISAWVGDIMSQEIYGYRPGSDKAHRIRDLNYSEVLKIDPNRPLKEQYLLFRDNPLQMVGALQSLTMRYFKNIEVTGGSFGISMARLWKGEVGAALLMPTLEKPWDALPVIGISQKLGFVFLEINPHLASFTPYSPPITPWSHERKKPLLVVHQSRLAELEPNMII